LSELKPPLPSGTGLTAHDPEFREAPDPVYDALRAEAPVYRDAAYGRLLLTRHEDVRQALRMKDYGVDARQSLADSYIRRVAGTGVNEGRGKTAYEPPLVLLDDPAHRRIRALVSRAFNPQSIEKMRGTVEEISAALLDRLLPGSEVDFIAQFAGPLPTLVIARMMGVDSVHCDDLKQWSDDILRGYDPERDEAAQERLRRAYLAVSALFGAAVEQRRAALRQQGQPPDHEDLIGAMIRAQEQDDRLSDLEIISLCTQLLVAGNVTTTDLLGNGLHALMAHPQQLAKLRANPALIRQAVEEILRYDCPLTETARIAYTDGQLGGCPVRKGETLTVSLAAANHDPALCAEPHRFDIERPLTAHLAFGGGIHVCLGAPLARLEGEVCIAAFLRRFPQVRPGTAPPRRRDLPFFRGFEVLPVCL
jgi:cytochrome P450